MLIADDHAIVRQTLVRMLGIESDFEIVGQAADGFEAVQLAQELTPDLVLMDLYMPGLDGIAATRQIKAMPFPCEVVVLTASTQEADVLEAVQAGAKGYILKTDGFDSFVAQVRATASGQSQMAPEIASKLIAGLSTQPAPSRDSAHETKAVLTLREETVLKLVAEGQTNAQIAEALAISGNTARSHVRSLMQKIGHRSRTGLAIWALHEGRTEPKQGRVRAGQ